MRHVEPEPAQLLDHVLVGLLGVVALLVDQLQQRLPGLPRIGVGERSLWTRDQVFRLTRRRLGGLGRLLTRHRLVFLALLNRLALALPIEAQIDRDRAVLLDRQRLAGALRVTLDNRHVAVDGLVEHGAEV